MRFSILIIILFLSLQSGNAQYLGGHFSYEHQEGNTYDLKLSLYLAEDQDLPDTLQVFPGDGSDEKMVKQDSSVLCDTLKKLDYRSEHLFPGSGSHILSFQDSSFLRPFSNTPGIDSAYSLRSEIAIGTFSNEQNQTVRFFDKPLKKGKVNDTLVYHPAFTNPDGDSLSFQLVKADTAPAYEIPSGISVNPNSGELRWPDPDSSGHYSLTMEVKEYSDNGLYKGKTQRHFTVQILDSGISQGAFEEISGFATNPQGYSEVHVAPGQNLNLVLRYQDLGADSINLESIGELHSQTPSPFFFTSGDDTVVDGSFSWSPSSVHARPWPYIHTFIAKSHPSCTYYYKTVMVYVDGTTSLQDREKEGTELVLYPQPARSHLVVERPGSDENVAGRILDQNGRLVKELSLEGKRSRIEIGGLATGVYHLSIGSEGKVQSKPFVVE